MRQSFSICASSLVQPGEGVKFHLHSQARVPSLTEACRRCIMSRSGSTDSVSKLRELTERLHPPTFGPRLCSASRADMLARFVTKQGSTVSKYWFAIAVGSTRVAVKMRQTEMAIFEFKRLLEQQECCCRDHSMSVACWSGC